MDTESFDRFVGASYTVVADEIDLLANNLGFDSTSVVLDWDENIKIKNGKLNILIDDWTDMICGFAIG